MQRSSGGLSQHFDPPVPLAAQPLEVMGERGTLRHQPTWDLRLHTTATAQ